MVTLPCLPFFVSSSAIPEHSAFPLRNVKRLGSWLKRLLAVIILLLHRIFQMIRKVINGGVTLIFFNLSWLGTFSLGAHAQGFPGGYPPQPSQGLNSKLREYCWRLQAAYPQGLDPQYGFNQCYSMLSWKAQGLRQQLSSLGYPSIRYFCQAYSQNGYGFESACPDELAASLARGQWVGNLGPFIGFINQRRSTYMPGPSAPAGGYGTTVPSPVIGVGSVPGSYECRMRSASESEYQNCLSYQQLGSQFGSLFQMIFK